MLFLWEPTSAGLAFEIYQISNAFLQSSQVNIMKKQKDLTNHAKEQ